MANKTVIPKETQATRAPVRREEWPPFARLKRDMEGLFDNFFHGFDVVPFERGWERWEAFSPRIDVTDTEKAIKVAAELPGMDEKDIDVSLTREALTIKGEKKEEKEEKDEDYYHVERSYGSFSRTIPLPVEVETDKVQASFKKGVLTITLPKSTKALKETKKVTVKAE
jgi:HSP20 family protein